MGITMKLREASSKVNFVITDAVMNYDVVPADADEMRQTAAKIREGRSKDIAALTEDKIILALLTEQLLTPCIGNEPVLMDYFMDRLLDESKEFDIDFFNSNPYIKNIDFTSRRQGDFELKYLEFAQYELFIYDVPKRVDGVVDIPRLGLFNEKIKYPALFQRSNKTVWMSITPNEIFTMEKPIENANGRVLTLGCGMGYFAYMASLKEDVKSVMIVEIDQQVIDLFENCILPQFENKDKITIVKADAVEFLKTMEDGAFDYCFADIWTGITDIEPYFAVKELGRKFRKTKFDYWIENSFATLLTAYVWVDMLQSFYNIVKSDFYLPDPEEPPPYPKEEQRKADYVHSLLKKIEITTPEQIDEYMDPRNIIKLINKTKLIF